jgi:hypothetical protein
VYNTVLVRPYGYLGALMIPTPPSPPCSRPGTMRVATRAVPELARPSFATLGLASPFQSHGSILTYLAPCAPLDKKNPGRWKIGKLTEDASRMYPRTQQPDQLHLRLNTLTSPGGGVMVTAAVPIAGPGVPGSREFFFLGRIPNLAISDDDGG